MLARLFAIVALVAVLGVPGVPAHAQSPAPDRYRAAISNIDALAASEHARDNAGSVTVGVIAGGALVWTRSYGYADMEAQTPASAKTVYRIGSITKCFTGLMLLQLAQEGRVGLADPVQKYFPEIDKVQNRYSSASPVTLVQLATMRSGLAREPANVGRYLRGPVADWEKVLLAALDQTAYESAPGSRYLYSNIGYAALGAALSRAAGTPYVRYIEERVLSPLGMSDTAFEPNAAIRPRIAKGYHVGRSATFDSELPQREHDGRGYKVPNGALYSTVGDLARFVSFELGNGPESVLPKKALDESFARLAWDNAREFNGYGIGMQLVRRGGLVSFGHEGDVPGYVSLVRFDRRTNTGVILLRSVNGGRFDFRGLTLDALDEIARLGPAA